MCDPAPHPSLFIRTEWVAGSGSEGGRCGGGDFEAEEEYCEVVREGKIVARGCMKRIKVGRKEQ